MDLLWILLYVYFFRFYITLYVVSMEEQILEYYAIFTDRRKFRSV